MSRRQSKMVLVIIVEGNKEKGMSTKVNTRKHELARP